MAHPQSHSLQHKLKGRNVLGAIQSPELNMSVSDCTCPICLEILVEPVVLPCKHELCLSCFSGMTDKTNFLCPMCRMRISTWSRTASNNNTLVNMERWKQIQRAFPKEIAERVEGKTAERIEQQIKEERENIAKANAVAVSKQGEIQREYEMLLAREQERMRAEREQEEQESLQYIQQVIAQEERLTVTDYINRINSTTPQPATQPSTIQLRNLTPNIRSQTAVHTPVIAAPSQAPLTVNPIPLRNRLLNQLNASRPPIPSPQISTPTVITPEPTPSALPNQPVVSSSATTSVATPDQEQLPRRLTRSSMKRGIEDAKNIRTQLLTSITESKSTASEMVKRRTRTQNNNHNTTNSSFTALSSDESTSNISTTDMNDSLVPPARASTLKRRGSARVQSNTSITDAPASGSSSIVRRQSLRLSKRSRPIVP